MVGCVTLIFAFFHVRPVIGSPLDGKKAESFWPDIAQWLVGKGGWVQDGIHSDLTMHGGAEIRGLVADSGAFMSTTLLEIPRSLWLELRFWPDLEKTSLAHLRNCDDLSKSEVHRLKFATGLALETRKGDASQHSLYFRNLPSLSEYESFHPSFMSSTLKEDFRSMPVVDFARKTQEDEARMQGCFANWQNEPQSSVKDVHWEEIQNGLSQLRNRGFIVESSPILIPVVDLINTAPSDSLNADVHFNMDSVSLIVDTAWLGSGQELLYGYCTTCDNNIMLSQWGVFLEGNTNPLPAEHKVDCKGKHSATNGSPGGRRQKSLEDVALAALDMDNYHEGRVPRCKQSTFASEQGPLRCSLARLAWEYCGSFWTQKPGALVNHTQALEKATVDEQIFLKARQKHSTEAMDLGSMSDFKLIPVNSSGTEIPHNVSRRISASQQRFKRLTKSHLLQA